MNRHSPSQGGARRGPASDPVLTRSESRLLTGLHRRKARETERLFLAEGIRVVEELAGSGVDLVFAVISTAVEDTPRGADLVERLATRTTLRRVSDPELRQHAATDAPQGVLAVARIPESSLEHVIARSGHLLVADAVQDPGNVGTLIRIADAFAAAGVVLLPGTVDAWNPKTVRSSAGSSFHLPVVDVPLEQLVRECRNAGIVLIGADAGGRPVNTIETGRAALVVGNEGAGLTPATRDVLDATVSVPMPGNAESLNVGVAAGILFYQLTVHE